MNETSKKVIKHYRKNFKKYGVKSKSLSWAGIGAAHQRYRQIWSEIDFTNKTVLDVGCGFGNIAKFITKRFKGVDYLGVDIMPEFIEKAKKLRPDYCKFEVRDFMENPINKKFDVVIASGVLNSDVDNNMEYRKRGIKLMFEHASEVFVFNMLGAHPQPKTKKGSNVWYADSLEILEYCMSLTNKVILRHHYHSKDFTIFMYPKD